MPTDPSSRPARHRTRQGSTAIEFGFVALPFLLLIFAILEIGLLLLLDALVETALSDASRLVRTGQAQQQSLTPAAIQTHFCNNLALFKNDCNRRAFIDIRAIDGFSNVQPPDPLKDGEFDPGVLTYLPGGPGDHVLVRVWYNHQIVTPFIAKGLSHTRSGEVLLTASLAFRNEPYL